MIMEYLATDTVLFFAPENQALMEVWYFEGVGIAVVISWFINVSIGYRK